jgi:hypothetical protein
VVEGSDRWRVVAAHLSLADRDSPDAQAVQHLPSLEQSLALFAHLGCDEGCDLFISGEPGERELMVGGGPLLYLVSCIGDSYGAYNLVDPAAGRDGWLTLHVGGVPSAVEASATVGPELAERAIRYFHAHGGIDPQLRWE